MMKLERTQTFMDKLIVPGAEEAEELLFHKHKDKDVRRQQLTLQRVCVKFVCVVHVMFLCLHVRDFKM